MDKDVEIKSGEIKEEDEEKWNYYLIFINKYKSIHIYL